MTNGSEHTAAEQAPTIAELADRYPEVEAFRRRMLLELWANRGKGDQASWRTMSLRTAWQEISWHAAKLAAAIKAEDVELIHELTADVANGAMMLDDIVHSYFPPTTDHMLCTHEGGTWPGLDRCADCGAPDHMNGGE